MPVPVSVSGWKSEAGFDSVEGAPTVMETSGPFAALAARKAEMDSSPAAAAAAAAASAAPAAAAKKPTFDASSSEWGVAVNNLDWSYPGIDGQPIEGTEPLIKDMDLKLKPG
jgi:CCR4-NOT complex subunit CAF16